MKYIATAALGLLMAAGLPGAGIQEQQAKHALDQAVEALGGPHFLAMEDRVEDGRAYSFYREELSGLTRAKIYTRYLSQADTLPAGAVRQREREAFGKNEDSAVLFTGDAGYQITFRGARPLPDDTLARYRDTTRYNIFYILRERLSEPGLVFDWRGKDVVDNQPVEIVDITDADNRTVKVYLNQDTHLPVRQIYNRRDAKTREVNEEVTVFSKYRDVGGGVMWPFAIERLRNGERIYQIFSDSVQINRELTDDLFTLPADMKILKKEK